MIGSVVSKRFYRDGWNVVILSRRPLEAKNSLPFCEASYWSTSQSPAELAKTLEKADAIVNLAG